METRKMTIHVTEDAYNVIDKYAGPRGRGQFISQLIVEYDRRQMDGDGVIDALRERMAERHQAPQPTGSRKRRRK
jgi:hypothetical protein